MYFEMGTSCMSVMCILHRKKVALVTVATRLLGICTFSTTFKQESVQNRNQEAVERDQRAII